MCLEVIWTEAGQPWFESSAKLIGGTSTGFKIWTTKDAKLHEGNLQCPASSATNFS